MQHRASKPARRQRRRSHHQRQRSSKQSRPRQNREPEILLLRRPSAIEAPGVEAQASSAPSGEASVAASENGTRSSHHGSPTKAVTRRHDPPEQRGSVSGTEPPAAEPTLAARRGPAWLLTITDFLERQLNLATNVDERIKLVREYTRSILAISALFLIAGLAGIWALTGAHPHSLAALAVGGAVTGGGTWLHRLRRRAQNKVPPPPAELRPSKKQSAKPRRSAAPRHGPAKHPNCQRYRSGWTNSELSFSALRTSATVGTTSLVKDDSMRS